MITIKAKCAALPVTTTNLDFMVQITEPIASIPSIMSISFTHVLLNEGKSAQDVLKQCILDDWRRKLPSKEVIGCEWLWEIKDVELTEHSLFGPKV